MEIVLAVLIIYAIYKNDHNAQIIVNNQIEIRDAIKGIEEKHYTHAGISATNPLEGKEPE